MSLSLGSFSPDNNALCKKVKDSETATWYLPPAGCGRWAHKVTKGLPENFTGKTFEVITRFKPNLACPLGASVDGAHQVQLKKSQLEI